jgi:pyrimidine-nucleoside phosphorylase
MNILDIIAKKRDKKELTKDEIEFFIKGYVDEEITDYQAAALVMAIYINGMNEREITDLTLAMCYSGDVLDLSDLGEVVDKHSTGGVGDKITLILMPIVASLGILVAKMSGRGLGFTGGTIDKLESIPGYTTGLDIDTFKNNVKKIGISLIGQTLNLAPADKKLYALRDTISCTESIPLIASSIMSKKIASGANKIVIDVTCGSGAFMKNREQAEKLASVMTKIGDLANRETVCVITNMDEPVGYAVGNDLEVIEAVDILKNKYLPKDIEYIITTLGANMLVLAKKTETLKQGKEMILENLHNGKGYEKFIQLVDNQGGDVSYIENTDKFEKAKYIEKIVAKKSGKITKLDALQIGKLSSYLGAGRMKKEDKINPRVGFVFAKKVGDEVKEGDTIGFVHADDEDKVKYVLSKEIAEIN